MSDARIRVASLVFSWPDGTPVLDGLSFALGPVRTGLVAPNGAGKSTLLKLLASELSPLSGQVAIDGVVGGNGIGGGQGGITYPCLSRVVLRAARTSG